METKRRPTHGMRRDQRLALERAHLIKAMPQLLQRQEGEVREGGRNPERSVKLKIARVVHRIRAISQDIGPVRKN